MQTLSETGQSHDGVRHKGIAPQTGCRGLEGASPQVLEPAAGALLLCWWSCFTPAARAPDGLLGGLQQAASARASRSASAALNASTCIKGHPSLSLCLPLFPLLHPVRPEQKQDELLN